MEPIYTAGKMHYSNCVAIFTDSGRKHFKEDRINEQMVEDAIVNPIWFAIVDPNDPSLPPPVLNKHPPTALIVCKRHPGALDNDLLEVLCHPSGREMRIFHAEHLTQKWSDYWHRWREDQDEDGTRKEGKRQ